jgi:hypothetical protein
MKLGQLTIISLCLTLINSKCEDYCPPAANDTYYCFSDSTITPNFCLKSCSKENANLSFICKFKNPLQERMCIYRCLKANHEADNALFTKSRCKCPRIYQPCCGKNNVTFFNSCFRQCSKVKKLKDGFCSSHQDWMVPIEQENRLYDPVCTDKGKYPNRYFAEFFKASVIDC